MKIGIDLRKNTKGLVEQFGKAGFGARQLHNAYTIYKSMLADRACYKVLTISGALISGGLRKTFVRAIQHKLVDCIITTGAILTHDLIESFGVRHELGSADANDVSLAKKNIDRIYDIYLPDRGYHVLEARLHQIFPKIEQREMSPNKFIAELGMHIKDKNSLIRTAAKAHVPIFCPAITDSILGFQAWMWGQDHGLKINSQGDIHDFLAMLHTKKRFGAIILGGGVPKNFALIMMQVSGKSLDYAIQITMDRPEHGGLSGAPLREAKSWKKISANARIADVICDATIAWPMLVSALC
jgi:deoxyhypusine synthase